MRKCELCGRPTVRKRGKACMPCTHKMRAEAAAKKAEESRNLKSEFKSKPRRTIAGSLEMHAALLAVSLSQRY